MTNSFIFRSVRYFIFVFMLVFPIQVFSSVIFSEVMYDLDGSDSGREWIEIFNSSSSAVSVSGWKFYEGESNHGLTLEQGSETLESGVVYGR